MKSKIIERKSKMKVYFDKCIICKEELKGYSEDQVNYNMRLHKEKHEKNKGQI